MGTYQFPLKVDAQRMAEILGCKPQELPAACVQRMEAADLEYAPLPQAERDAHILSVLKRLDDPNIRRTTEENIQAFERGWRENLELCRTSGLTRENLRPKYVRPYSCIRFCSDYVRPKNPFAAYELLGIAATYSFLQYFQDCNSIYEFGCGTAQYLFELSQLFPGKTFVGTDWTEASVEIIKLMAERGINISGCRFDMLKPDTAFKLSSNAGVLTVGAMEQIGDNFESFFQYLLSQKPRVVVHHEPTEDFYGTDNVVDYLGLMYHRRRGYLSGYLPRLREAEKAGLIKILATRRMPFGDPFHESGSLMVWRPEN